jgi:hypothetical protein
MPIYLGNTEIGKQLVDSYQLGAIYLGSHIVQQGQYDADAQAFIDATGISGTNAAIINQLVLDLKSANLWTKMKAVYPMIGGTSTTCKYNLINPVDTNAGYRLTFSGGWTFSSTGANPNGTNAYANTYLPQTALTSNSGHISYYSRENGVGLLVSAEDVCRYSISPNNGTNDIYAPLQCFSPATVFGAIDSRGFFIGTRTGGTNQFFYANAVDQGLPFQGSNTLQNFNFYLAARNNGGTSVDNYTANECAFASIGDGLNSGEVTSFNTLVQSYQTSLNRNV